MDAFGVEVSPLIKKNNKLIRHLKGIYLNIKLSTELNISLDTPLPLREKSKSLNIGYIEESNQWRLIIKHIGNVADIAEEYEGEAVELLGGFAIISLSQNKIDGFAEDPRILFIDKPVMFVDGRTGINGFVESCMSVPYYDYGLRGKGIVVGIIDSGIDIFHSEFLDRYDDISSTKLVGLWDQTLYGNPPTGYYVGTFFNQEEINKAINDNSVEFLSTDISGHGTAVAGVISSCTPEAKLLVVKLNTIDNIESDTISLIMGIDFVVRYSIDNNVPMVINLSYGNNYGDHNGNSIIENYLNIVAQISKITIVTGVGNDGNSGRHTQINMSNDSVYKREIFISDGEGGINIQIWNEFQDKFDILLTTPSGVQIGPFGTQQQLFTFDTDDMNFRILRSGPSPINVRQETFISIIPLNDTIESGIWSVTFFAKTIVDGRVDIWLPVEGSTNTSIYFLETTETTTLTIPSTAENVISVGAYNSNDLSYAPFSGRGFTVSNGIKPDVVAPGVNIDVPKTGGGYTTVSGTSFATPFVASAVAMLMEYGIVANNDPFLYGEKVKAYIISGAKGLLINESFPSEKIGWGALCVENSLSENINNIQ